MTVNQSSEVAGGRASLFLSALIGALAVCFALCSWISRSAPFQYGDSATFYYEGLLIAHGARPFVDFIDNKNPGIYFLLAWPASLGGWDMWSAVLLFRMLEATAIFIALRLALLVKLDRVYQALLALALLLAYTACFPNPRETFYTEIPEMLLGALVCCIYFEGAATFWCGLALGVSLIFRQTAFVDLVSIGLHRVYLRMSNADRGESLPRSLGGLLIGTLIVPSFICMAAIKGGWLDDWWRNAYIWNRDYAAAFPPFYTRIPMLLGRLLGDPACLFPALLSLLAIVLICCRLFRAGGAHGPAAQARLAMRAVRLENGFSLEVFLLLSVALHAAEAAAPGIYYPHHLIPLLPSLAMLSAYFLNFLAARESAPAAAAGVRPATSMLLWPLGFVMIASAMIMIHALYREHRQRRHDIEYAGEWVARHTAPEEKILAWGLRSELYLAARRHAASSFHHNLSLTNQSRAFLPIDRDYIEQFRRELAADPPRYIFLFGSEDAYEDLLEYFPAAGTLYSRQILATPDEEMAYLELLPH